MHSTVALVWLVLKTWGKVGVSHSWHMLNLGLRGLLNHVGSDLEHTFFDTPTKSYNVTDP